ncbi:MAG: hypothetical protein ACUVWR_04910 [Anaerolineae bacterium]
MVEIWLHGRLADNGAEALRLAASAGVQNVVMGASQEEAQAVRTAGMKPWAGIASFPVQAEERQLLCRSVAGEPVLWFGSGCPNHPLLRQRLIERVRTLADWDVEGIFLDGIRFASPFEGADTYFTCTCYWCQAAAVERGFSWSQISTGLRQAQAELPSLSAEIAARFGKGAYGPVDGLPLLLRYPALSEWLRFRAAVITETVAQVKEALKRQAPGKRLGAYLFTPALAPLVGQDYTALAANLDVASPMIYRFGDGPACLPAEVLALAAFAPASGQAALAAVLPLLGLESAARPGRDLLQGMTLDALGRESARARARLAGDTALVPILWLDDPDIAAATAAALAGCPEGVSYFATGEERGARMQTAASFLRSVGGS